MHPLFEKADALTAKVVEAAVTVQKHFGIGLLENIYKLSLAQEMRIRGHKVETEKVVSDWSLTSETTGLGNVAFRA